MTDTKHSDLPPLPEPLGIHWPELHSNALGCGVEDRNIHDRYEAAEYGWQDGVDRAAGCVPDEIFDADQMRAYARAAIAAAAPAGEPVAWGLLSIMDPELTNDPEIAGYWQRKGRKVTPLYDKFVSNMTAAANFIDQRAADYLRDNASHDPDEGSLVFEYGEAGREYHNILVELAEDLRSATPVPAAAPIPNGMVLAPEYRGYAHLGLGLYLINHSKEGEAPELAVSIATEAQKAGRVVGDERANEPGAQVMPEDIAVRLRFENVAGLDALESQLRKLRAVHFPESGASGPNAALVESLQVILPKIEFYEDCGPQGEGWQSAELVEAINNLRAALAAAGVEVKP